MKKASVTTRAEAGSKATQQTARMEDYLKKIALLSERDRAVKVTEISKALAVTMPSVSSALAKLSEVGLVKHERYRRVQLTPEGERVAQDVLRRHEALRRFLAEILGIDPEVAAKDACKMEHSVSPVTHEKLAKFVEFMLSRPQGQPGWLKMFDHYFKYGEIPKEAVARWLRR